MIAKTQNEIEGLRKAGRMLGEILAEVAAMALPGVKTSALDLKAHAEIEARGAVSAFFGYKPGGASYAFPATLCVSVNDEVVHGIPSEGKILKEGDLVMLDLGLSYNGYFADAAVTLFVGKGDERGERLLKATREALSAGIKAAKPGATVGDIGAAIEAVAKKYGYGIAEDLGGHSLGLQPHEPPFVPNYGEKGSGEKLEEGMVLALEPIFTEGDGRVYLADDQWTYKTEDGSRSCEFEHTILVTKNGAEILTQV